MHRIAGNKPYLNMTNWKGSLPKTEDAKIAKNYMLKEELEILYLLVKQKVSTPSLKDTLKLLAVPAQKKFKKINLKLKRDKLTKQYQELSHKFQNKVIFSKVLQFIYKENYTHNFADYATDLIKLGIPEKMCFQKINLFQDLWNYFPHKQLDDKCPYDLFNKQNL